MILIMGLPGAGKGTQGKIMADQHRLHLITMGDIIRIYVTGERRARMLAGELLEDDEVIEILERVLDTVPDKKNCVLDGFPRTIHQAEWLEAKAESENFAIEYVIYLDASVETVKARLRARGRMDDKEEVIVERFKEFERETHPLVNWFSEHQIKVVNINAERSVDEVNIDVLDKIHLT